MGGLCWEQEREPNTCSHSSAIHFGVWERIVIMEYTAFQKVQTSLHKNRYYTFVNVIIVCKHIFVQKA